MSELTVVWVVHGTSESGDHYIAAFDHKPSDRDITILVRSWDYDPDNPGPGYADSWVDIEVLEEVLR